MAKDVNTFQDLEDNAQQAVKQTVKQTMDQTRGALDSYFSMMQKAISSLPSGGTDFGEKIKTYAETNISSAQDFVNKLSQAKDLQDITRIQTEYMQTQFKTFGEQTKNLSEVFTKAATGAVRMPFQMS